jgi:hypothetical protein
MTSDPTLAASVRPLNIVSVGALETIPDAMLRGPDTFVASSLRDVARALEAAQSAQTGGPTVARAIDLIGHSTRDHQLLRLGSTVVDALDLTVLRFFEGIARSGLVLGIGAVCLRLLGCETAMSPSGQRTMRILASVLGIRVYGSRKRLSRMHHNHLGFDPRFQHVLVSAIERKAPWLQLAARSEPSLI